MTKQIILFLRNAINTTVHITIFVDHDADTTPNIYYIVTLVIPLMTEAYFHFLLADINNT